VTPLAVIGHDRSTTTMAKGAAPMLHCGGMEGKLVPERDYANKLTGRTVCVSCSLWNCWHAAGRPCDITGCECTVGSEYQRDRS
jgi:hypothetical protein